MPNMEHELTKLSGSHYFVSYNLSHGYWQLPLDEKSQVFQYFIIPEGIYSPTRVLNGTTNADNYLQSPISEVVPSSLHGSTLYWLDDIILRIATIEKRLAILYTIFQICSDYNIKTHPAKCILLHRLPCGVIVSYLMEEFDLIDVD